MKHAAICFLAKANSSDGWEMGIFMRKSTRCLWILAVAAIVAVTGWNLKSVIAGWQNHRAEGNQQQEKMDKKDDGEGVYGAETDDSTEVEQNAGESEREKKQAFLTFDDGPSKNTKEVLAILEQYGIPATFFVIGNQIDENTEDVVRQAVSQGCLIGVHTYCHKAEEIYNSAQSCYDDILEAKERIETLLKKPVTFYRFPWGSSNCYVSSYKKEIIGMLEKDGLEYADWNVSGEDSVGRPGADSIISHVKKNYQAAKDPVILLHDSAINKETVKALPVIIELFLSEGYTFDTLDNRREPCHFCFAQ